MLRGGAFVVLEARPKEVAGVLEALGVEFLDEVGFYSRILLPHLEAITRAGGLPPGSGNGECGGGEVAEEGEQEHEEAASATAPIAGENHPPLVATISDTYEPAPTAVDMPQAAAGARGGAAARRRRRCMLGDEVVLAGFLEETLARIESRYVKPGGVLQDFVERLQQLTWVPTAHEGTAATLAAPTQLRDPHDPSCRLLFPPHRFPCAYLQQVRQKGPADSKRALLESPDNSKRA